MPRKSIVSTLLEHYSDKKIAFSIGQRISHIIVYNFPKNPSPRFYDALEGLGKEFKIKRLQKGVLSVESINAAYLVLCLLARYKGRYSIYFASEMDLREIYAAFGSINWSGTGLRT
jgi:hypothetical protein